MVVDFTRRNILAGISLSMAVASIQPAIGLAGNIDNTLNTTLDNQADLDEVLTHVDRRLSEISKAKFTEQIEFAIKKKEFGLAKNILDFAAQAYPDLAGLYEGKVKENSYALGVRYTKGFISGFLTGDILSNPTLIGSICSDFSLTGDARDLVREGHKLIKNVDYDPTVLGLAVLGFCSNISMAIPNPSLVLTSPIKLGTSLFKGAIRKQLTSQNLLNFIKSVAVKMINIPAIKIILVEHPDLYSVPTMGELKAIAQSIEYQEALKGNIDFSMLQTIGSKLINMEALKKIYTEAIDKKVAQQLFSVNASVGRLVFNGGPFTAYTAIQLADRQEEIEIINVLAKTHKMKTAALITVLERQIFT